MEHRNYARVRGARLTHCLLASLLFVASSAIATPLSQSDEVALRALSAGYVQAWLNNDRAGVMGIMAPDAVFIPHDGVKPKIGYAAIDAFWFPGGKPAGVVTAFRHDITAVSGEDRHGTIFGRSNLTWENGSQRFNWIGNFLINVRKVDGRWLATHMMASDEEPRVTSVAN